MLRELTEVVGQRRNIVMLRIDRPDNFIQRDYHFAGARADLARVLAAFIIG